MISILTRAVTALAFTAAMAFAADDHDHHHHGDEIALATKRIGVWQVTANRLGEFVPGKDAAITVDFAPAAPVAKSVRVWIGGEDGKGATKAKAEPQKGHPGTWHCHVEVPSPLPAGAAFWVAVETEAGEQVKESFPLAAAAAPAK